MLDIFEKESILPDKNFKCQQGRCHFTHTHVDIAVISGERIYVLFRKIDEKKLCPFFFNRIELISLVAFNLIFNFSSSSSWLHHFRMSVWKNIA